MTRTHAGWGFVIGVSLAAVQLLALPLLHIFSNVDAVRQAAVRPAIIASLMQVLNGLVFAGEGILIGLGAWKALAVQTAIGAVLMVGGCAGAARWDLGLTGIWLSILVFNLVQLAGVLRYFYVTGALRGGASSAPTAQSPLIGRG